MLSSSKNLVFDALHDPQECLYNLKCKYLTFPNLLNIYMLPTLDSHIKVE